MSDGACTRRFRIADVQSSIVLMFACQAIAEPEIYDTYGNDV